MPYAPGDPRQAAAQRRYYEANRARYRAANDQKRAEIAAFLKAYKEASPCEDCGVSYPAHVMDLDHRPGEDKVCEPAKLSSSGSWTKVHAEIAKCDLVCSNCHRQRTHDRAATIRGLAFDPSAS